MSRDGASSRAQQTKNWCVGFSFPPPAYAGIHPTLYLFGFRANPLNSHSPTSLPGFDPGSGLRDLRGLRRGLQGPPEAFGGPAGFMSLFGLQLSGGLQRPPQTLRGPPGPLEASGAFGGFGRQDVGFGSGFRVFFGLPALLLPARP